MQNSDARMPPNRGRPSTQVQRHVVQDLMEAAEAALTHKTARETTVREIAAAAGANEAMVNYYFGSKDGLWLALFQDVMRNAPYTRSDEIVAACISQESIKPLIEQLADYCCSRKDLIRMISLEMLSYPSSIKDVYDDKYSGFTAAFIEYVINSMIDCGIYKKNSNVNFFAISIISSIMMPTLLLYPAASPNVPEPDSPDWINHIAGTVDLALKSPLSR
jgi:AcrR family transcriptional regulator